MKDNNLSYSVADNTSGSLSESVLKAFNLRIDDSNFKLVYFEALNNAQSHDPFYQDGVNVKAPGAGNVDVWQMVEAFIPVECKLNQGFQSYTTSINLLYGSSEAYRYSRLAVNINNAAENDIIFIQYAGDKTDPESSGFVNEHNPAEIKAVDQFGNEIHIEVGATSDGFEINSIT